MKDRVVPATMNRLRGKMGYVTGEGDEYGPFMTEWGIVEHQKV